MQESTINNPKELVKTLKNIKYLIEAGKVKPINVTEDAFDFYNFEIIENNWPDFFSNEFYDLETDEEFMLTCDTYHGNCQLRKSTGKESIFSRFVSFFSFK